MELESPHPPFEQNFIENLHFVFRNPSFTLYEDTKSFASYLRNQDFWPKNGQICQIFAFLVHFGAMPDQKTMRMRCLDSFLIYGYQKFYFLSQKIRILAQKWPN